MSQRCVVKLSCHKDTCMAHKFENNYETEHRNGSYITEKWLNTDI